MDPATPEFYTLSLHDALPICAGRAERSDRRTRGVASPGRAGRAPAHRRRPRHAGGGARPLGSVEVGRVPRSEEHTSELQSRQYLVCRLLLEKKKKGKQNKAIQ